MCGVDYMRVLFWQWSRIQAGGHGGITLVYLLFGSPMSSSLTDLHLELGNYSTSKWLFNVHTTLKEEISWKKIIFCFLSENELEPVYIFTETQSTQL